MLLITRALLPLLLSLPMMSAYARPFQPVTPIPAPTEHDAPAWCAEHGDQCGKMKAQHDAFCEKNPISCKRMEAKREADQKWCKDNPNDCKKLKEEHKNMREQRREKMQEHCKSNPKQCERMKQNFRKNHPKAMQPQSDINPS